MLEELLNKLKNKPCIRLDYKVEQEKQINQYKVFKECYPLLFSELDSINCHVPRGWFYIADDLFSTLESKGCVLKQVKQKFAELRVYTSGDCEKEIATAVALSRVTCEFCGSTENVSLCHDGYISRCCWDCKVTIATVNCISELLREEEFRPVLNYFRDILRKDSKGERD